MKMKVRMMKQSQKKVFLKKTPRKKVFLRIKTSQIHQLKSENSDWRMLNSGRPNKQIHQQELLNSE